MTTRPQRYGRKPSSRRFIRGKMDYSLTPEDSPPLFSDFCLIHLSRLCHTSLFTNCMAQPTEMNKAKVTKKGGGVFRGKTVVEKVNFSVFRLRGRKSQILKISLHFHINL